MAIQRSSCSAAAFVDQTAAAGGADEVDRNPLDPGAMAVQRRYPDIDLGFLADDALGAVEALDLGDRDHGGGVGVDRKTGRRPEIETELLLCLARRVGGGSAAEPARQLVSRPAGRRIDQEVPDTEPLAERDRLRRNQGLAAREDPGLDLGEDRRRIRQGRQHGPEIALIDGEHLDAEVLGEDQGEIGAHRGHAERLEDRPLGDRASELGQGAPVAPGRGVTAADARVPRHRHRG